MKAVLQGGINLVLSNPTVFQWQQKFCNNYDNLRDEFAPYFRGASKQVLDVGCSTGAAGAAVVDMKRHQYTGIDIDPKYTEFAQSMNPDGKYRTMDASRMDFPDASFDIVLMSGVLHHIEEDLARAVFKEVERVLRPGGYLLICEPLFTPGKWFSNFLLSLDRGRFIRPLEGYKELLSNFKIEREGFFRFSVHRFCSFALTHKGV